MAQLLITGGAGFIGSHSCLVLLEAGHNLVVLDNFDNSSPESLKRVLELAGPSAVGRLRYFNPVGAHPSGRIGEDPRGIPNNLFPFVSQVAVGRRDCLQVFGGDWPTPDGSGIRDYIHVMDLAEGHRAALDVLLAEPPQLLSLNLGSGQGHSVLEVVRAFELASGRSVPYTVVERRDGDAASTVADPRLAATRLGWRTRRSLEEMCRDGWAWQQANPEGYGS